MRNAHPHLFIRSRRHWSFAAAILVASGVALSASIAQGPVEPGAMQPASAALSPDTVAIVTGGGTVELPAIPMNTLPSFAVNAKRPPRFTGGRPAARPVHLSPPANVAG